jgi:multiple sugar transport system permease protein
VDEDIVIMVRTLQWFRKPAGRRTLIGYSFILPFILGFLLWNVIPFGTAGWLAFQEWNMIRAPRFVFFDNFARLFADKLFWQSLKVTTIYSVVSVPLRLAFGFLIAVLLNTKVKGMPLFRTIFYMPSIVPSVANAVLWAWILNSEFGLLNAGLALFGIHKIRWLQEPELAMPALIFMSLWSVGGSMVIYLAGLQGIPDVYYEAADIDGAGTLPKFFNITIPLMSPIIFFNLIMGIISSFQVFTAGFLITNGGPQNATLFYVLHLYRTAFQSLKMGYAAAMGWILFLIILVLTYVVFKWFGSQVYYEDGE